MSEPDLPNKGQQIPPAQDQWQDQVVADTIGYTKGLVSILDSLSDGFRRRGRELEELRQRLGILQSERRTVLEERSGLEAQIRSLTTDRDALGSRLEGREREGEQLRQDLARVQAGLEARTREIQDLRAAVADSTRKAEELQKIAQGSEEFLVSSRRELASSQQLIESLRASLDEERSRTALLQERMRSQGQDLSVLDERLEAYRGTLAEIAGIVGGPPDPAESGTEAGQEAVQWGELVQAIRHQAEIASQAQEIAAQAQEEIAALKPLAESVREVLGTTEALPERLRKLVSERTMLQQRLEQFSVQWHQLRQEQAQSVQREQALREEHERLSQNVADLTAELEAQRAEAEILHRDLAEARERRPEEKHPEIAGLDEALGTYLATLAEINGIVGGPPPLAGGAVGTSRDAAQWGELVQTVKRQTEMAAQLQEEVAALRPLLQSAREVLGATDALPERLRELAAERAMLERRLQHVYVQAQRLQQAHAESTQRERQLREEQERLSAQVAALTAELESQQAHAESAEWERQLREEQERLSAEVASLTAELEAQRAQAEHVPPAPGEDAGYRMETEPVEVSIEAPMAEPELDVQEAAAEFQPLEPAELMPRALEPTTDAAEPEIEPLEIEAATAPAAAGELPSEPAQPADESRSWDMVFSALWETPAETAPPAEDSAGPEESAPSGREADLPTHQPAPLTVECTVAAFGGEPQVVLQGTPAEINEIGMVAVFEKNVPVGRVVMIRLRKGDEEFLVPGSVVRVQASEPMPGAPPTFDHLIRFEHPKPDTAQRLKAFLP